ncbi:MAG: APC family permease [Henriciella sp.]
MSQGLRRSIGPIALSLYGIGVTIGAGIFVLLGETVRVAGHGAPLSFVLAGLVAALSALTYIDLSSRYPVSSGEAVYVRQAWRSARLSQLVGFGVVAVGVLSSATILQGFAGYAGVLTGLPGWLTQPVVMAGLILIAIAGVRESVWTAGLLTLLELGILIFVIAAAAPAALSAPGSAGPGFPVLGLFSGAAIAFFAFIGFEDIVNLAEEVRQPRKSLPIAIGLTLGVSTLIYVLLVGVAVRAVDLKALAASADPLVEILRASDSPHTRLIGSLSVFAILNGALIQIIMASRVLYGMARTGDAPDRLSRLMPRRRTPYIAILLSGCAVLLLALTLPLGNLARMTSFVTLSIFLLMNLSLLRLRRLTPDPDAGFRAPTWVPWFGAAFCLILMGFAALS